MKIGDAEVLTLREAGERIGVSPNTLLIQIRNGALVGERMGKQWVVTAEAIAAYDERRKVRGVARPEHPLHGKRGGGGRRKAVPSPPVLDSEVEQPQARVRGDDTE